MDSAEKEATERMDILSRYVASYWEGDENISLSEVFNHHGDPARRMWRSCLLLSGNRLIADEGKPKAGKILHAAAEPFMTL